MVVNGRTWKVTASVIPLLGDRFYHFRYQLQEQIH